ncbi:MAG: PDZ domain-containing protein [Myxococcota bacterium]|nr:PDZ domain-containing protein [Myxococcota bacterium]
MKNICLRVVPALLLAILVLPAPAEAGPPGKKRSVAAFYAQESQTIATVEFVQEFVAGGQKQQTRGYTDGVVISADGLVLISGRVRFPQRGSSGRISGGSRPELSFFRLHFSDGREHRAEVVAFEDDLNLGLLRIVDPPEGGMPHARFRRNYKVKLGQSFRSMTLYTEDYGRTPVLSSVFLNAILDKPQDLWSLGGVRSNLLGAPLWDGRGNIVGVIAQVPMSPWAGRQVVPRLSGPVGLSYERFADWVTQAASSGPTGPEDEKTPPPQADKDAAWLGVMYEPLDKDLAAHLKISAGGGLILSRVVPSSPADKAGLKPLDVLVELDGERIEVLRDSDTALFSQKIRSLTPGTTIRLTLEHPGGERKPVEVVTGPTPTSNLHAERQTNDDFGLTVRQLTLDTLLRHRLDPGSPGVVVDGVTRAGWAGLSGLRVGLIIQRINEHEVSDLESFTKVMALLTEERPEKVLFFGRSGKTTRFFVAEPDWSEVEAAP